MPIVVTYLRASITAARPIVAGVVLIVREVSHAVVLASGQNVVLIGLVVPTLDPITVLVQGGL